MSETCSAPAPLPQTPSPLPAVTDPKVNRKSIGDIWWSKSARIQNKVSFKRFSLSPKSNKDGAASPSAPPAASPGASPAAAPASAAEDEKSNHVQFTSPLVDEITQHERDFVTNVNALVDLHFTALRQELQLEVSNWLSLIKQELELVHAPKA